MRQVPHALLAMRAETPLPCRHNSTAQLLDVAIQALDVAKAEEEDEPNRRLKQKARARSSRMQSQRQESGKTQTCLEQLQHTVDQNPVPLRASVQPVQSDRLDASGVGCRGHTAPSTSQRCGRLK